MPPVLLSGLSCLPVRSRRSSRVCFRFPSKVYSRSCSSNQWHILVERASVRPHHKSCAVFSVSVCFFGFASFSRLKLSCSRSVPPLSSPISSLIFSAEVCCTNFILFPVFLMPHVMSSSLLWRSSVVCVNLDSFPSSSFFLVKNFSLTTAYCFSWHLYPRSWVSGHPPHAGHTPHATLPALYKASHVQTPLMCIALRCPRCHCVSCLDRNRCSEAVLSIPFAASSL